MPRVVTLTTDFGSGSGYVAELKGHLLQASAEFSLVDISHDVTPHDIRAAAWLVGQSCPAFPAGTLHIVVVDPGVGTDRPLVWARLEGQGSRQDFLCPDNGVLTLAMKRLSLASARRMTVPPTAAATFHGRDVLAPLAVQLLDGLPPEAIGQPLDRLTTFHFSEPQDTPAGLQGEILHVDAFGNLITNLPATLLPRLKAAGRIRLDGHEITTVVRTYRDALPGTAVVLVGSQGFIEVAVVIGRADERFSAGIGTQVSLP